MRVIERPFSDLLRHPKDVTSEVEDSDVLLRRRDEPDLRLSRADREVERTDAFRAMARAFRNLAIRSPGALGHALGDAFGWLEFLPAADRREFADEFARVVTAAAELDNYGPLSQLVREWRATAEVHADPRLARRLRRPVEAGGDAIAPPAR
ncbi:MAG: DUF6247 family protein [Acidimicrobiales bacterium]